MTAEVSLKNPMCTTLTLERKMYIVYISVLTGFLGSDKTLWPKENCGGKSIF